MLLQSLELQFYLNSQEKTTKPNLLGKLLFVRLTVESQIYDDTSVFLFGPLHDVLVLIAYAQNPLVKNCARQRETTGSSSCSPPFCWSSPRSDAAERGV